MAVQRYTERVVCPYFRFYCDESVIAKILTGFSDIDGLVDFNKGDVLFTNDGVTIRHKGDHYELVGNSPEIVNFGKEKLPKDLADLVNFIITSGINRKGH